MLVLLLRADDAHDICCFSYEEPFQFVASALLLSALKCVKAVRPKSRGARGGSIQCIDVNLIVSGSARHKISVGRSAAYDIQEVSSVVVECVIFLPNSLLAFRSNDSEWSGEEGRTKN